MKSFHSLTSQFSCRCYFCEFLMFPLHAWDFHMYAWIVVLLFLCTYLNVCSFVYIVATNLLLCFIFPFTPPLSFVNYHVTPGNQTPPHHTHWHFVYHDLLPAVHDYVIILFFYVPCALYILTLCMCIVFEKFVFLTFWKKYHIYHSVKLSAKICTN